MKNICLVLEYVGTNYCGFQKQKNGLSIQEVLENTIFEITNEKVKTTPSGRTDAGVHALGQVVNFLTSSTIPPEKFKTVLNLKLPKDIRVKESFEVDLNFNSRKSAKQKTYEYKIFCGEELSAFDQDRCLLCKYKLDLNKINMASMKFLGTHDFSSFVASNYTAKTTIRTIYDSHFEERDGYLYYVVTGNGFLYNMVRIIVGTLLEVGRGKIGLNQIDELLQGNNRQGAGRTVSPSGLYLKEVKY